MSPAKLKSQLAAQVDEPERLLSQGYLLHPDEIIMILDLVLDFLLRPVDTVNKRSGIVYDLEFPVGGQIMSGFEQSSLEAGIVSFQQVIPELIEKASLDIPGVVGQLLENQLVDLPALFSHHLVKNGRLDVRKDDSLQKLENPPR